MDKQMEEREALYNYKTSTGEHIAANRECFPFTDEAPEEEAIQAAVKTLKNCRTGERTNMRLEDLKVLLARAEANAKAQQDGDGGLEGAGDTWQMLVWLILTTHMGHGRDSREDAGHHCGVDIKG